MPTIKIHADDCLKIGDNYCLQIAKVCTQPYYIQKHKGFVMIDTDKVVDVNISISKIGKKADYNINIYVLNEYAYIIPTVRTPNKAFLVLNEYLNKILNN